MDGAPWDCAARRSAGFGSVIGAVGGSVFALANRGALDRPWPTVVLVAWAIAFAAYLWSAFFAVRPFPPLPAPRRGAGLVYVAGVLGMLGLMAAGSELLRSQGPVELQVSVVVLVVGLHFLPFAWAFHARVFALLGSLLAGLGVTGLILGWACSPLATDVVAVLAGLGMLAVLVASACDQLVQPRGRRRRADEVPQLTSSARPQKGRLAAQDV